MVNIKKDDMAEFCSKCALEMFGVQCKPDIDVNKIFEELQEGFVESGFLCEGCGLVAISKMDGKLKVMRVSKDENEPKNTEWEDYTYDGLTTI